MKQSEIFKERQTSKNGIRLLKAYTRCLNLELKLTYICIAFSLLFFTVGLILNFVIFANYGNTNIKETTSTILDIVSFFSGIYLIVQIFLLYFAGEFGKNKVTIMELFDSHVFKFKSNPMLTRPISEIQIDDWAYSINKSDLEFAREYFLKEDKVYDSIFANQVKTVNKIYGLLNFAVSRFYIYVWSAVIAITIIATIVIGVKEDFVTTMVTVLVPALSIITMVANSYIRYIVQRKQTHACIAAIRNLETKSGQKEAVSSQEIRNIQDSIFQQRLAVMNIPKFISKKYDANYALRESRMMKKHRIIRAELEAFDQEDQILNKINKK